MPATPQITINYSLPGFSGSNVSAAVVPLPANIDATMHVRNGYLAGGFWVLNVSGGQTFIPVGQIISISSP
jgi:hypothetical protein